MMIINYSVVPFGTTTPPSASRLAHIVPVIANIVRVWQFPRVVDAGGEDVGGSGRGARGSEI